MSTVTNKIESMSEDDLRKFVDGAVSGRLFTSAQVADGRLMQSVFMPIFFGVFADWTEEEVKEVGVIWEWMDQAGPRSINGMPMFMSMRLMNKEDWKRALDAIQAESERRKTIKV
jgi:hypothetical protein